MKPNRLKLILAGIVIVAMVALMLWFPAHQHHAQVQQMIEKADTDVAAAKAAADDAAASATKAKDSARDAENRLPGSS
jgi:type II secretory pathway component PulM